MNENILKAVEYAFDNNVSDMQDEINNALLQKVADAISGKRIEVAQTMMSPAVSESDEEDDSEDKDDEDEEDEEDDEKLKKKLKGKKKETNESYIEENDIITDASDRRKYIALKKMEQDRISQSKQTKNPIKKDNHIKMAQQHNDAAWNILNRYSNTNESYIEEKLSSSDDISVWIRDFIESDNPRFDGKSKEERIQMAKGAYYSAKKGKTRNEEVEELDEISAKLAYAVGDERQKRSDKAWNFGMNPDMETYEREGKKSEKAREFAKKRGKKVNWESPKPESWYPELGSYDRKSGQSGSN